MVETKAFDLGRDGGMRGWPLTTRLLVALAAGVVAGPSGLAAEAGRKVASVSWAELKEAGKLGAGEVVASEDGQSDAVLRIASTEPGERTYRLTTIDEPQVTAGQYALRGRVRYTDVEGAGYIEMWSRFADGGRYFSRTLDERGPMGKLSGTSDWRVFVLPFFVSQGKEDRPVSLEVNVILPGRGVVELGAVEMVEYATREAAMADAAGERSGWWSGSVGGLIGAVMGILLGTMGGLVGFLASRGQARGVVMGLMKAMAAIGIAALAGGVAALVQGQPYAVYYPLLLAGLLCTVLPWALVGRIRQQYEAQELRKMEALDSVSR